MARREWNGTANGSGGSPGGRSAPNAAFARTSFLFGANAAYIEQLEENYSRDPSALDQDWRDFFASLKDDSAAVAKLARGPGWKPPARAVAADELLAALDSGWREAHAGISAKLTAQAPGAVTPEEARAVIEALLPLVHLLIVSPADARTVLDVHAEDIAVAQAVRQRTGVPIVATPLRDQQTATAGRRYSAVVTADGLMQSEGCLFEVVDPIGSGDAYDAGFLYGYLQGDLALAMRCADALSALKHTVPGDVLWTTADELQQVLQGALRGIVR